MRYSAKLIENLEAYIKYYRGKNLSMMDNEDKFKREAKLLCARQLLVMVRNGEPIKADTFE